jgi:2-C-methyl-D-erythritol 4-phosphate cytidylyltransferase/2-C-methyl-D-erythritol 2,4-cyclodiphosphate synthase
MHRGSKRPGHKSLKAAAVIAAGGTGIRMNSKVPKQFLELAGKPILLRTIESISSLEEIAVIIVALPPEHIEEAESILLRQPRPKEVRCVSGGPNRQESVRCGVAHVDPDADVIMVHDAVRPLCDREVMKRVLNEAWKKGAAVPCLPATETIQRVSRKGRVLSTPPRQELHSIQTPQAFHAGILKSALDKAHPDNIKITRPLDLESAELLISKKMGKGEGITMHESGLRIGHGIDYHRLVEGRRLILGGVEIPYERGLAGHSDADVLSHAVCDAVLGAAGLGDIGRHFPDTDPSNRDRSSLEFLREVKGKIEAAGWRIRNVDATLLAQQPRLAPHMPAMRKNIAESLGLDTEEVNIKATTTEGLNAEGRGEGMSAQAIALLCGK